MHQIVYYIIISLIIGAIGMSIANKKAESKIKQQRWLKYFMYILITGMVVLGIFFNFIIWVAAIIVTASLLELLGVNFFKNRIPFLQAVFSLLLFSFITVG